MAVGLTVLKVRGLRGGGHWLGWKGGVNLLNAPAAGSALLPRFFMVSQAAPINWRKKLRLVA